MHAWGAGEGGWADAPKAPKLMAGYSGGGAPGAARTRRVNWATQGRGVNTCVREGDGLGEAAANAFCDDVMWPNSDARMLYVLHSAFLALELAGAPAFFLRVSPIARCTSFIHHMVFSALNAAQIAAMV